MSEAHAAAAEPTWQGGGTPFAVGLKKFGMWLFIVLGLPDVFRPVNRL